MAMTTIQVTEAEAEILSLLRGEALRQFTFTVTRLSAVWTAKLAAADDSTVSEGQGLTFEEAWICETTPRRFDIIEGGRK